ncbi:MAG TPA: type I polyketide synthase, partial [Longimicrobium sp.]|nr:type I polyketide synthase [Longimicrobium sp.]
MSIHPPPAECAEPVAVTGYACRLPGAASAGALWDLLSEGRDGVGPVPPDRWSTRHFHHADPDHPGTLGVREGGFLSRDLTRFDAAFFGIAPREAECMDPQQRLLLEVAWEALEHAGLPLEGITGREVGTYVGGFMMDHHVLTFDPANRRLIHRHTATGTPLCMLSNRLAHALDLRGPSLTVDTACSSSLVALHTAAVALSRGECEAALVGGVNVMTRPDASIALTKGRFLSPGARCRAFDARADGYARAEGAGVLVLRRLRDARADGDTVHAVLLGTGVNQDGRTPGLSHPSAAAQAALLRRVARQAGVAPDELAYAEAHGTGTRAGDRAEALALGEVYGAGRAADDPLVIGTVKAHVGHLEAAAGVAGVIRALLTLRHRRIPAALHFHTPSPDIPFDALRLRVAERALPLPPRAGRTVVSVSSFGYGGTNAHALLASTDPAAAGSGDGAATASPTRRRGHLLLPVSARSEAALRARAGDWGRLLAHGGVDAADLCFTAARRLSHLEHRLAVVGRSRRELAGALRAFAEGGPAPAGAHHLEPGPTRDGALAFVFTGMGTQTGAMGRELARRFPAFRRGAREADDAFRVHAGWSVLAATLRTGPDPLRTPRLAQPLNFIFQAGLVALWRWLGVHPDAVVGHSVGEISAAWCAGALTLDQAAGLVFHRSRLQEPLAGRGTMLAAALSADEAARWAEAFPGEVSVAALNGANSVTLAGSRLALEKVAAALERSRVFHRFLPVDVAYHGPSMDEIRDGLLATAPTGGPCGIPLYSTVTGGAVDGADLDPEYWWRNARAPVRFADAAAAMVAAGCRAFVEIGPHPVLAAGLREALMARRVNGHAVASQRRGEGEDAAFLRAAGHLYAAGRPVDWRALYPSGRTVELPAYPWQRERHWLESEASRQDRQRDGEHPLLGRREAAPGAVFRATWSLETLGSLAEHRVRGRVVLPAAAYVEAVLALSRGIGRTDGITVRGLSFEQPLVVPADSDVEVRFALEEAGAVSIHSTSPGDTTAWRRHGRGFLDPTGDGAE